MNSPNYRAFARDMMKLCKKHGIKMSAYYDGHTSLGPSDAKLSKDVPYDDFEFSPTHALLKSYRAKTIEMTNEDSE